jgi:hemoglobin/transferrin/lactoferrin receptor protein
MLFAVLGPRLACAAIAVWGISLARAQETQLNPVVVTATRSESPADAVPATITSVGREDLERRLPRDEADLFRDEPDLVVPRDLRRFGATRINIRGIEDNRVVQLVDGVRLPSYYNGAGPTNFTLSGPLVPSLPFLKRVEVLRGPASSLYGSDALGGVVGYLTLDPADLLGADARLGARVIAEHDSADRGTGLSALAAGGAEPLQWLLGATGREGREPDNKGGADITGPARTRPNPQETRDAGLLAKVIARPAPDHRLGLTLEGREREVSIDVRRTSAALPRVSASQGDDESRRARVSLEWEHKPQGLLYDRLTARLFHQQTDSRNENRQTRSNTTAGCSASLAGTNTCLVEQLFEFEQRSTGGSVQLEKALAAGGLDHFLIMGVDASRVRSEQRRDATARNQTTGALTKTLAGDAFPLRDFAPGYTDTVGIFLRDDISGFAGGRLTLTPGLRYDWRTLQPEPDALSQGVLNATRRPAVEKTDSAFSPKLAALYRFDAAWSAWGQVVRGFRAPNYEEVNAHFRNTAQSYAISPNPNLEPETSTGVELGLRHAGEKLRGQLAVFDNRYKNFIESVRLACPRDPNCVAGLAVTFMSVNLRRVRIYGAEARGTWDFAPGWVLSAAAAYAHGTDEDNQQPLNSVEPARLTLGLARDAGTWGAEARLRAAARKTRVNDRAAADDPALDPWFRPPGYAVADLYAWWRPSSLVRLTVAVTNLFDKRYWLWGDIRQADARNPLGVDFFSQTGRAVSVALQVRL